MPPDHMQSRGGSDASYTQGNTSSDASTLVRWVMAAGLARDERAANYILIGIAVVAALLALLVPSFIGSSQPHVSQQEVDAAMRTPQPTTP